MVAVFLERKKMNFFLKLMLVKIPLMKRLGVLVMFSFGNGKSYLSEQVSGEVTVYQTQVS